MTGVKRPGVVRVDAWSKYPWLKAGFSTRVGGQSKAYNNGGLGELNLGWTASDTPEIVAANRKLFLMEVSCSDKVELVTVRQSHSDFICVIRPDHGALSTPDGKSVLDGDGLVTDVPGLFLGIQTADCVPVLVADTRRNVVAAFHAGWRGTVKRIVGQGIGSMQLKYGSHPEDLVAAIGPCIRACCYAVGEDVMAEFQGQFRYGSELFSKADDSGPVPSNMGPQIHLDLVEANRRQLLDAGLAGERISVVGECTACARLEDGNRKYFSHRDERGYTGRMLSVIGVVPG